MRTAARESAFKIIFASRFDGGDTDELKRALIKAEKLTADDVGYLDRLLSILKEREGELLTLIDERSRSFPEARLFPADKSALLIALAEILYMDDVPAAVSANEAANIASKYSTPKSADFISGILAEVIKK